MVSTDANLIISRSNEMLHCNGRHHTATLILPARAIDNAKIQLCVRTVARYVLQIGNSGSNLMETFVSIVLLCRRYVQLKRKQNAIDYTSISI